MIFDLKSAREKINMTSKAASKAAGITESLYRKYEAEGRIPCKYVYNIWSKNPDYPIPEDFFCYTSFTLQTNMTYYKITQEKVAELFGFSGQGVISKILSEDIPMYEMKEMFQRAFNPVIVPLVKMEDGQLTYVTRLVAKGNFMNRRKKIQDMEDPAEANIKEVPLEKLRGFGTP